MRCLYIISLLLTLSLSACATAPEQKCEPKSDTRAVIDTVGMILVPRITVGGC